MSTDAHQFSLNHEHIMRESSSKLFPWSILINQVFVAPGPVKTQKIPPDKKFFRGSIISPATRKWRRRETHNTFNEGTCEEDLEGGTPISSTRYKCSGTSNGGEVLSYVNSMNTAYERNPLPLKLAEHKVPETSKWEPLNPLGYKFVSGDYDYLKG